MNGLAGTCVTGGVIDVAASLENTFLGPQFELLTVVPESMDPNVSMTQRVRVDPREDNILVGSVKMRYRMGNSGPFETVNMSLDGLNIWKATVPGASCDESPEFYFEMSGQTAGLVTMPSAGPFAPYGYFIGEAVVSFSDDFNTDKGWTVSGMRPTADGHVAFRSTAIVATSVSDLRRLEHLLRHRQLHQWW